MNFNGKFWHKPGHLGMTTAELLEKLNSGGSDFSAIRGKEIELTVNDDVITYVEVNDVSINPSDFFAMPYVDILLTLSHITILGLTVGGDPVEAFFDNGTTRFINDGFMLKGLFTYYTPDGTGLGHGTLLINAELEVNFDIDRIFVTP